MTGTRKVARCGRRLAVLAVATFTVLAPGGAGAQETEAARAVKATYLYKFAPFVEWPASAFPSSTAPFHICVVGDDAFGRLVARAAEGQRVGDRDIVVQRFAAVRSDSVCHILYVSGDGPAPVPDSLAAVHGRPVLTVTDAANSGDVTGMVHFVIHQGRVRFEIDDQLAREHGLAISSKVLQLAIRVRPRAP